ncbi:MAG: T9SS type A sorting domain-containing protein [Bacteroidales bacterium]|nr:T9SS type A sorting domain-containing protein [Bacteroidales bacterium]
MKYKRLKISAFLLLAIGLADLKAQEAIPTAGGNATGSGGSVSYTVGQVVFISSTGTNGSVTAGVQQPYEISVVTGLEPNKGISLVCSAYPNPTTDFLILRIEDNLQAQYSVYLYNTVGSLLKNIKIEANETRIDMSNLVIATYFLKIVNTTKTSTTQEVKTFKIIKN